MRRLDLEVTRHGALVRVRVGLIDAQRQQLRKAARDVAPLQDLQLVVDTGASHTVIDEGVMRALQLEPVNSYRFESTSTRGVADRCNAYAVSLEMGGTAGRNLFRLPVLEVMTSTFVGDAYQGLLGREVLSRMHLAWRGPAGVAVLEYP